MCSIFLILWLALPGITASLGLPRRGFFGAQVSEAPEIASGEIVSKIFPKTSAEVAGIRVGDLILTVAGISIVSGTPQFVSVMGSHKEGEEVEVRVSRAGKISPVKVVLKPFPCESSPDFDIEYQAVKVDGELRRTIVTRPGTSRDKYPAVLFVGGIGCNSIDLPFDGSNPYKKLLYALTKKGFLTLRVEKRGMGDSEGGACFDTSFQSETNGYLEGLRELKKRPDVDSDRVFIIGHSIGGIIAPILANLEQVRGVVVVATVSTLWFRYEVENSRRQYLLQGLSFLQVEEKLRQKVLALSKLLLERKSIESIQNEHPDLVQFLKYPMNCRYIQAVSDLNFPELWSRVTAKVLVVCGAADYVTSEEDHRLIAEIVNADHPGKAEFVKMEGLDHHFTEASSQKKSFDRQAAGKQGEYSLSLEEKIATWLESACRE